MAHGDASRKIRDRAVTRFIEPARRMNQLKFDIDIKPLMRELEAEGFTKNRPAQFCTAVQKSRFGRSRASVSRKLAVRQKAKVLE